MSTVQKRKKILTINQSSFQTFQKRIKEIQKIKKETCAETRLRKIKKICEIGKKKQKDLK